MKRGKEKREGNQRKTLATNVVCGVDSVGEFIHSFIHSYIYSFDGRKGHAKAKGSMGATTVRGEPDDGHSARMNALRAPRRTLNTVKRRAKREWARAKRHFGFLRVGQDDAGIPDYLIFNKFIYSGYRVNFTIRDSVQSLFELHNETMNIWTHALGFVMFLCLTVALICSPPIQEKLEALHLLENASVGAKNLRKSAEKFGKSLVAEAEYWPMFIYLIGAMACMLCSTLAHTFSICSPRANRWWWRVDYVGIAVMICTSFFPPIYYIFLNDVQWRIFYLVSITILGICVATISLLERFQDDRYRTFRAMIFVALAAFGVFPVAHTFLKYSIFENPYLRSILCYESLMATFYVTGAVVYSTQFPECAYPGKFDIFFSSHQWFHILIVIAAYCHYVAGMHAIDWRYGIDSLIEMG